MSVASIRRLWLLARTARGEHGRLLLSVVLAAGAAAAAIALLSTSGYLISRAAQRPEILSLMVAIVAVRAFGITRAVLRYAERLSSHDLALRQLARLRVNFYRSLVGLVPGGIADRSGDLLSRFVADVETLKDVYVRVAIPGMLAILVVAGATIAAWIMLPAAGIAVLLALTLAALTLPWLSGRAAARSASRQAPARARLTSELIEAIDGAVELTLAGRARDHVGRLGAEDASLARIGRSDALASSLATAAGGVLAAAGTMAVLIVAIGAVHSGVLSGVLLAALVFLVLGAYESVLPLSAGARALRMCTTAAGRLSELTDRPPVVEDPRAPLALADAGSLRVERVDFRYAAGEPWVLRDASLEISRGERVALIGPSGAGKSTLAELLVRFNDPTHGGVSLGGVDVRDLAQSELRRLVLLCDQDCHVFNTSIRENLLLARRDAGRREVLHALAIVELAEWAACLPQGLDTIVGRDGQLLSGGQRRRLALARALLSSAPFLILDEPTAHLDPALAGRVLRNVLSVCDGRGVLVITHDTSAVQEFDRTFEIRDGLLSRHEEIRPFLAAA